MGAAPQRMGPVEARLGAPTRTAPRLPAAVRGRSVSTGNRAAAYAAPRALPLPAAEHGSAPALSAAEGTEGTRTCPAGTAGRARGEKPEAAGYPAVNAAPAAEPGSRGSQAAAGHPAVSAAPAGRSGCPTPAATVPGWRTHSGISPGPTPSPAAGPVGRRSAAASRCCTA